MSFDSSIIKPRTDEEVIRSAFDNLNIHQLAILARLTATRRLQIMFEICAFAQQSLIASEPPRHPEASDEGIAKYVRARVELGYDAKTLSRVRSLHHLDISRNGQMKSAHWIYGMK